MTQEDKELLLKDLCARLPYGVKCNIWYGPKSPALNEKDKYTNDILETINPQKGNCTFHNAIGYDFGFFPIEHVKPYLRPMSSMTGKEYNIWHSLMLRNYVPGFCNDVDDETSYYEYYDTVESFDYLNSIHVDYRDLIQKSLALEAPEGMYKDTKI